MSLGVDFVRYVTICDLFVIVCCGALVLRVYHSHVVEVFGAAVAWLAVVIGSVFVVMAASVAINIFASNLPPTPGVRFAAPVVTLLAAATVALTALSLSRR